VPLLQSMPKGEKEQVRVPLLQSLPKGEIVSMFYRQCILVIDGKCNNDDGLCTGRMCQVGNRSLLGRRCKASSTRSEYAVQ
jgi:hypothetical protein